MKIFPKKIICTLLSALCIMSLMSMPVLAHEGHDHEHEETAAVSTPELYEGDTFTDEVLTYNKASGGVYVTKCNSNAVVVSIGEKIDGYKILGIYDGAFANCTQLKEVSIDSGITYIGPSAFAGCVSLEKLILPDTVTTIPAECFAYCGGLVDFEIPKTVTSIGEYAFAYANLGETLELWEGLETLGASSFYYCTGIKTVAIPSTLTSVGSLAFLGCKSLENFVVSSGNTTFSEVDGVLYSEKETILEIFPMAKNVKEFAIPDTVTFIPAGAFFDNEYLENITMSDSVQVIDEGAFSNCTSLRSITLSNSLTVIEGSVFSDCKSLKSIEIPASVTAIGDYAFLECTSLKSVTIPDTVKSVGAYAFGFTDDEKGKFHVIEDFVIKANFETAAKEYADEYDVEIDYLDGNKELPVIIAIVAGCVIAAAAVIVTVIIVIKKKKKKDEYYKN